MSGEQGKQESGFFPLPQFDVCRDTEHEPPSHLYIPQGQGYRHICPSCGKATTVIPAQVTL